MTGSRVHVDHYANTEIETIDFIADKLGPEGFRAYVLGNILKYASRALYKGVFADDLEKIRNYAVILQEHEAKRVEAPKPKLDSTLYKVGDKVKLAEPAPKNPRSWDHWKDIPEGVHFTDTDGDEYVAQFNSDPVWADSIGREELGPEVATAIVKDPDYFGPYVEVL